MNRKSSTENQNSIFLNLLWARAARIGSHSKSPLLREGLWGSFYVQWQKYRNVEVFAPMCRADHWTRQFLDRSQRGPDARSQMGGILPVGTRPAHLSLARYSAKCTISLKRVFTEEIRKIKNTSIQGRALVWFFRLVWQGLIKVVKFRGILLSSKWCRFHLMIQLTHRASSCWRWRWGRARHKSNKTVW